jgi:hypothetical protein
MEKNNTSKAADVQNQFQPGWTAASAFPMDVMAPYIVDPSKIYLNGGIDLDELARAVSLGWRFRIYNDALTGQLRLTISQPNEVPRYRVFIVEEYKVATYQGQYGAGQTVKTFTLLPNEETTISIRTYMDTESKKMLSSSVLDSINLASASDFQNELRKEVGSQESSTVGSYSSDRYFLNGIEGSMSANVAGIASAEASFRIDGGFDIFSSNQSSTARQQHVNSVDNAVSRSSQRAETNRQIEVTTTSEDSIRQGMESSTVRVLRNINKSRIMRTSSLIVDALLGRGEALDCFNKKLQNTAIASAEIDNAYKELENERLQAAIQTLEQIDDPRARSEAYYRMFNAQAPQILPVGGGCCGPNDTPANPHSFEAFLGTTALSVARNGSAPVSVTVVRNACQDAIQLSALEPLPLYVTVPEAFISTNGYVGTLTVSVGNDAVPGVYTVIVQVRGCGQLVNLPLELTITNP